MFWKHLGLHHALNPQPFNYQADDLTISPWPLTHQYSHFNSCYAHNFSIGLNWTKWKPMQLGQCNCKKCTTSQKAPATWKPALFSNSYLIMKQSGTEVGVCITGVRRMWQADNFFHVWSILRHTIFCWILLVDSIVYNTVIQSLWSVLSCNMEFWSVRSYTSGLAQIVPEAAFEEFKALGVPPIPHQLGL